MAMKVAQPKSKENAAKAQALKQPLPAESVPKPHGMAASLLSLQRSHGNRFIQRILNQAAIQRKCSCGGTCGKCQSKSSHQEQDIIQNISQRQGSGQLLEPSLLAFKGTLFGENFRRVSVHPDSPAAQTRQQLNPVAYTVGQDILFATGQYQPQTLTQPRDLQSVLPAIHQAYNFSLVHAQPTQQSSDTQVAQFPQYTLSVPPGVKTPLYAPSPIPSNTVHCVKKWNPCSAPYSPGSWAAKVTYHCPRFVPPIVLPGTTEPSYITIPDEFIGTDSAGRDLYSCRPGWRVRLFTDIADVAAASMNRTILYPDFVSCHAGYRRILRILLEGLFRPRGGGRPAGVIVGGPSPPAGIPCP
jgi:Domain of unknown function (DUF4157)